MDVVDNPDLNRFEARTAEGDVAGYAEYQKTHELIVFTHTEVLPAHEGKGVGSTLVSGALDQVRGTGLAVLPLCPFVKAYIGRHPEYTDLVYT
ncbi:GNAT family N-acetyltransferase [Umezawaea beigongshangensis]|uniref:GNAT family N-acetyltransferase n=1 Tax=Umezawaea beigongshangensis TaxID=2780383 RepID=UPI0027DB6F1F|nr:GNAT family N-acetyltransferase [Umezawaea beigongshangensis]